MKRGFLNNSKAMTRPLGPALAETPKRIQFEPIQLGEIEPGKEVEKAEKIEKFPIGEVNVEMPEGYGRVPLQYQERDPREGSMPDAMTITFTTVPTGAGPDSDEPFTEPAYRMSSTPDGKGTGLFSTRALTKGDRILTERPLYVGARGIATPYPAVFTRAQFHQHGLNEMEKSVALSISRMRPEAKMAFMALKNSHQEDGSGPLTGIGRTNGICLDADLRPGVEGKLRRSPTVTSSSSCSPSTHPSFDVLSFSYQLFAVRDIAAGEELTFQNIDVMQSTAARGEALKPYDFVCTCASCNDPKSDARRAAIKATGAPSVHMWLFNHPLPDDWVIAKCREQARLNDQGVLKALLDPANTAADPR
ncbi:hypothetical protein DFH07DRAFT_953337 [Mycena maculata]|uniref:SET domain-containing protein n=1 Tax=Mycena maculata TaxID=230809 RepID=A0AAD7JWR2_9AGAR|nr:hypothetical protein DFH07DRAFT_953337 [Mycena maculata]